MLNLVLNCSKNVCVFNFFRFGINVVGISSDGDSRLLSIMKTLTSFDLKIANLTEFVKQMPYSIQDMIHIGTKLRNRLLNSSIIMCIGIHIVSILHIKILLDTVAKEVHGLVSSDIFPEDRQNYGSLEKLMDDRVINALKEHVADSEATIMYLHTFETIRTYLQHLVRNIFYKMLEEVVEIKKRVFVR